MSSVEEIIARMTKATGAKDQQEMLEKAGFSVGLASKWKNRGAVPARAIEKVSEVTGVTFVWLKNGHGAMRARPPADHGHVGEGLLSADQKQLLDLWEAADDDAREYALDILKKSAAKLRAKEGGGSDLKAGNSA